MPIICNTCAGESPILLKNDQSPCDFCIAEIMEKRGDLSNGKKHCRCYAEGHPRKEGKDVKRVREFTQEEITEFEQLRKIEESKVIKKRSFHYDYWSDDVLLELFNWLCSRLKRRISLIIKTKEVMSE